MFPMRDQCTSHLAGTRDTRVYWSSLVHWGCYYRLISNIISYLSPWTPGSFCSLLGNLGPGRQASQKTSLQSQTRPPGLSSAVHLSTLSMVVGPLTIALLNTMLPVALETSLTTGH